MAKPFHKEHYLPNPYNLFPKGTIYPNIEQRPKEDEVGQSHYLLPAVFVVEKGASVTLKYPGDAQYEDTKHPGVFNKITVGTVIHLEKGAVLNWSTSTEAKGFAAFIVPMSVKSFDEFVVQK